MLQNEQWLANDDGNGESITRFQRAYLTGNIGGAKITAGRYNDGMVGGDVYDNRVDGIKAVVGKDVKFTAAYGKLSSNDGVIDYAGNKKGYTTPKDGSSDGGKYWRVGLNGNAGKFALEGNYIVADDVNIGAISGVSMPSLQVEDKKIWTLGADYKADNWHLGATYLHGSNAWTDAIDGGNTGYIISLGIGSAKASKPGTVGFWAKYYSQPNSTVLNNGFNGDPLNEKILGYKGYGVGVDYTVAKNMVAGIQYFDLKDKDTIDGVDAQKTKTIWSQLVVTF